jgi:hypothetical protein
MDKEECNNITKIHGQEGMQKISSHHASSSHKEECNNITKIHGQGGMQKFSSHHA